jgi:hypothetical protein
MPPKIVVCGHPVVGKVIEGNVGLSVRVVLAENEQLPPLPFIELFND